ncbi:MAG: c-type cytochrome [Candidatus Limnocylindrales bacterium]|jgi:mono/diheme cytochrome c family protein
MSDQPTGRELTPREPGSEVAPRETAPLGVERFDAGERAHRVELTEERAAQVVRQSGNARRIAFLFVFIVVFFIPLYWFYAIGVPALGVEGQLERTSQSQYITDVSRGYALYQTNCSSCHGVDGKGGVGAPLNDQMALFNAYTPTGDPGTGHLNPLYIETVLAKGGRYVCGDARSVMPVWAQPIGPLNYREVEELITFLGATTETTWTYVPHVTEGEEGPTPAPVEVRGWRDPNFQPAPDATPYPACWRDPDGPLIGGSNEGGGGTGGGTVDTPGTVDSPRVVELDLTAQLSITDPEGTKAASIPVVAGETVTFQVTNTAGFDHNFYLGPEATLSTETTTTSADLPGIATFPSGSQEFTYTFDTTDPLQFACIIPGHYQPMHGDFEFVEP